MVTVETKSAPDKTAMAAVSQVWELDNGLKIKTHYTMVAWGRLHNLKQQHQLECQLLFPHQSHNKLYSVLC